jgi:hypothetical protein
LSVHRHPFITQRFPSETTDEQAVEGLTIRLRAHIAAQGWTIPEGIPIDYRITRTRLGLWVVVQTCAEDEPAEPDEAEVADPPPLPEGDLPWDPAAEAERFLAEAADDAEARRDDPER